MQFFSSTKNLVSKELSHLFTVNTVLLALMGPFRSTLQPPPLCLTSSHPCLSPGKKRDPVTRLNILQDQRAQDSVIRENEWRRREWPGGKSGSSRALPELNRHPHRLNKRWLWIETYHLVGQIHGRRFSLF